jgi:hypothetical protein
VSDTNPWQSPSGATPPPPPGGGTPPPPPPPPPFGGPAGPPPGWTPPPKPGLIPLAPMTLGTILGASFRVLRRNPRPVVGFSLIIHGVLALLGVIVTGNAIGAVTSILGQLGSGTAPSPVATGGLLLADLTEFAVAAVSLIGSQILQGIITIEVARGTVGEKLPLRALWARARGRVLVLVGWAFALVGIILGAVIAVTLLVALVVGAVAASGNSTAAAIVAVVLALVLFLGGLLLALWIGIKLSLVPSILVLERLTLGKAMARSWSLTKDYFWRTFGIEILVWVMLAVAAQVIQSPVAIIGLIVAGIGNPTGTSTSALLSTLSVTEVASTIVGELVAAVTGIIQTASTALIYLDLRMRKEGLDLTLMKFVDARSAGEADLADPYIPVAGPTAPPSGAPHPVIPDPGPA